MRYLLLLFTILCCHYPAFAQADQINLQDKNLVELRRSLQPPPAPVIHLSTMQFIFPEYFGGEKKLPDNPPMVLASAQVPPAWQYDNLAFFCKLEVKMEKALKMPVKVRLGEVQAVERMEGKLKSY